MATREVSSVSDKVVSNLIEKHCREMNKVMEDLIRLYSDMNGGNIPKAKEEAKKAVTKYLENNYFIDKKAG